MPLIYFTSCEDCVIETDSGRCLCQKDGGALCPLRKGEESIVKIWGVNRTFGDLADPVHDGVEIVSVPRICLFDFTSGGDASCRRARAEGCSLIDWGAFYEAKVSPVCIKIGAYCSPIKLDEATFGVRSGEMKAELYLDGGLRLSVSHRNRKDSVYFGIGRGITGRLGIIDVGSKRLLTVSTEDISSYGKRAERMIIVDENAETLLDISGDKVTIADGMAESITALDGSVCAKLVRRYDINDKGGFDLKEERTEPVFGEEAAPNSMDTALCFISELARGRYKEARRYLSDDLSEAIGDESLSDFFGSFSKALPMPTPNELLGFRSESEDAAVIGLFDKLEAEAGGLAVPKLFSFRIPGRVITDVSEITDVKQSGFINGI